MSTKRTKEIVGFVSIGSEIPFVDPSTIKIVGVGYDLPETAENWFAHCARLAETSDEDLDDYATSVRASGKVDVTVKCYRDGDDLVVLDGRSTTRVARRIRAEQPTRRVPLAERVSVRARIYSGSPEDLYRVNAESHRARPLTRMQEARTLLKYHQATGEDAARTAAFFRVDASKVRYTLRLFDLAEGLQTKVDEGFPVRLAERLSRLPRGEQIAAYAEMMRSGAVRGTAGENAIAGARRSKKPAGGAADKTRARSRAFLEKCREEIAKVEGCETLAAWLGFYLGGPVPADALEDDDVVAALRRAGLKTGLPEVGAADGDGGEKAEVGSEVTA